MQRERRKTEDLQLKMHPISKTGKILLQIFTIPSFYGSFEALRQGISVAEKTPALAIENLKIKLVRFLLNPPISFEVEANLWESRF